MLADCGEFGFWSLMMLVFIGVGIAKLGKAVVKNPEGTLSLGSLIMSILRRR